jgi:hypothetical protein
MAKPTSKNQLRGKLTPTEVRSAIHEICENNNYDPFEDLIEMAVGRETITINGKDKEVPLCTVDQRIAIARELAQYLAPKLKSIEVGGQIDHDFVINVKKFGEVEDKVQAAKEAERALLQSSLATAKQIPVKVIESEEDNG